LLAIRNKKLEKAAAELRRRKEIAQAKAEKRRLKGEISKLRNPKRAAAIGFARSFLGEAGKLAKQGGKAALSAADGSSRIIAQDRIAKMNKARRLALSKKRKPIKRRTVRRRTTKRRTVRRKRRKCICR